MRYQSKPTEIEAQRWNGRAPVIFAGEPDGEGAHEIVAWVNANGGEARYEPERQVGDSSYYPARIAVRTINGWAYAEPGDYVVMGSEWIKLTGTNEFGYGSSTRWVRDFYRFLVIHPEV